MPYHVVDSVSEALNMHKKKPRWLQTARPWRSLQKDVDDLRESHAENHGNSQKARAHFDYNDPYFPQLHKMRHYRLLRYEIVPLSAETLGK